MRRASCGGRRAAAGGGCGGEEGAPHGPDELDGRGRLPPPDVHGSVDLSPRPALLSAAGGGPWSGAVGRGGGKSGGERTSIGKLTLSGAAAGSAGMSRRREMKAPPLSRSGRGVAGAKALAPTRTVTVAYGKPQSISRSHTGPASGARALSALGRWGARRRWPGGRATTGRGRGRSGSSTDGKRMAPWATGANGSIGKHAGRASRTPRDEEGLCVVPHRGDSRAVAHLEDAPHGAWAHGARRRLDRRRRLGTCRLPPPPPIVAPTRVPTVRLGTCRLGGAASGPTGANQQGPADTGPVGLMAAVSRVRRARGAGAGLGGTRRVRLVRKEGRDVSN